MSIKICLAPVAAMVLGLAGSASAGFAVYGTSAAGTSTTLFGSGDRRLDTLAFTGSATTMTSADFVRFGGGRLVNSTGSFGWTDPIARDTNTSGHVHGANPDRADLSTSFGGENAGTGTLAEVFGSPLGYKNLSWIVDSEDNASWTLDLFLSNTGAFAPDANPASVELSVLERGSNSDFSIAGITGFSNSGAPILTAALHILRNQTTNTGWTLNTLEISGAQQVAGVGISLPSDWGTLYGVRVSAVAADSGPDIVAVGMIPAPGPISLAAAAGLIALPRRRYH